MAEDQKNSEFETIEMRRATWLVIFEYLARSSEEWKKRWNSPDDAFMLSNPDSGERVALWRLESEIERTLPELFASDYKEWITAEKQRLSKELYGL